MSTNINTVGFSTAPTLGKSLWLSGSAYFAGDIAEVLIFSRALTAGERAAVNGYLNGKYGVAPVVSITAPANNAMFAGGSNITLAANAFEPDGGTIKQVEFFKGTASLGICAGPPYSMTWNNVVPGNYALTARATGDNGLISTSSVVNVSVPLISIISPVNNAVLPLPSSFAWCPTISAVTVNGVGISQVEFFQGTTSLGVVTTAPYNLVWNNVSPGNYSLTAVALLDDNSTSTSFPVNVTVQTDTDGDGLSDFQKYLYGINPQVSDGFWIWVSTPSGLSSTP